MTSDSSFTKEQLRKIEMISQLFLDLEKDHLADKGFDALLLEELIQRIKELEKEDSFILKKLSETTKHLVPEMSLKHFINCAIPFERALKRNLQDDEFLVTSQDHFDALSQRVPLVFVLENIRSSFNVGAFFRTAECLGVAKIMLTGYTASPLQSKVEKTAMGTSNYIPWEHVTSTSEAIQRLIEANYQIIGVETSPQAQPFTHPYAKGPTAFIFGNERFGLESDILKLCDEVRSIPVYGVKNSLNVGIAAGIIGYQWRHQYEQNRI